MRPASAPSSRMPPGAGQAASHVMDDVEVGIVYPQRMMQAKWHLEQAASHRGNEVDAALDQLRHALEGITTRHFRRIEHSDHGHVHVHLGCLQIEKRCIQSR